MATTRDVAGITVNNDKPEPPSTAGVNEHIAPRLQVGGKEIAKLRNAGTTPGHDDGFGIAGQGGDAGHAAHRTGQDIPGAGTVRTANKDGGFTDTTKTRDGTFVHVQSQNGDYTESSYDSKGKLKTPPIEVMSGVSPEFAQKIKDEIARLPAADRKAMAKGGFKYVITDKVTHADPSLAGVTPRGNPEGTTFDDDGGVTQGAADKRRIIIAEFKGDKPNDRLPSMLDHESGHGLDSSLGQAMGLDRFTDSKQFNEAYKKDFDNLSDADKNGKWFGYDTQVGSNGQASQAGKQEAFADVYAALHGPAGSKAFTEALLKKFPHVAALIKQQEAELANSQ